MFDDPDRDDLGRVFSVAHVGLLSADDVEPVVASRPDLRVISAEVAEGHPSDHDEIVRLAVDGVRRDGALEADAAHLLGEEFTLRDLQVLWWTTSPRCCRSRSR